MEDGWFYKNMQDVASVMEDRDPHSLQYEFR